MENKFEKCYISRDEKDNMIWVWRRLDGKIWEPTKLKDCDMIVYQRPNKSLENADYYLATNFKKKFGIIIAPKIKKCVKLLKKLLDNEDYKLVSNDPERKK